MDILTRTADSVGEALGIDIRSRTRIVEYVEGRAIYYNISRNRYNFTFHRIGREVGRDHASVMHGLKVYDDLMATDVKFRNKCTLVEQYVIANETLLNDELIPCNELLSENKKLKIQIKELILKAQKLELELDSLSRIYTIIERLNYKIPQGKELEAEKQINRFLNGLRL